MIEIEEGHSVYTDIPEHFAYTNKQGVFDKIVHASIRISGELMFLAGKYIVVNTTSDGGSTGRDSYPNGHHVWCVSADGNRRLDFYQTGCFNTMITGIKPIGTAKLQYVFEEQDK